MLVEFKALFSLVRFFEVQSSKLQVTRGSLQTSAARDSSPRNFGKSAQFLANINEVVASSRNFKSPEQQQHHLLKPSTHA
jgi:hypothetical protein